jgi:ABC-2 type transport system permease protein
VLALVILGYLISTVGAHADAGDAADLLLLPALALLSGFMFPFRGMPGWAQALGEILPLTHFLRLIRAVMLKGGAHWIDGQGQMVSRSSGQIGRRTRT